MSSLASYPSLAGRTVAVTGGASGIGADIVCGFIAQGARVGFVDRDRDAAAKLLEALGAEATLMFEPCDVTDIAGLRECLQRIVGCFGPVGVLVNNVASDDRHALDSVTPEYFDQRVAINLRPHFFAAQAVAAGMRAAGGGAIVNIGSTSWKIKGAGYPIYATCKSAATGLTRSLARELGKDNIRVNTVTPGWVMTERQLKLWVDAAGERAIEENQCLPGRVHGFDVANMVLFLAADDSRMITAQEFVVDGGWT